MAQTSRRYEVGRDKEVCRMSMIEQAMGLQPAGIRRQTAKAWAKAGDEDEGGDPPADVLWGD